MYMELPGVRTWILFYLISFVVLLWAAFLSAKGVMLWVSLMLVIVIVGVNFYVVFIQIKVQASRKQMQHDLTKDFVRGEKQVTDDRPKH
jgi:Flp pilus assembly protein TadB